MQQSPRFLCMHILPTQRGAAHSLTKNPDNLTVIHESDGLAMALSCRLCPVSFGATDNANVPIQCWYSQQFISRPVISHQYIAVRWRTMCCNFAHSEALNTDNGLRCKPRDIYFPLCMLFFVPFSHCWQTTCQTKLRGASAGGRSGASEGRSKIILTFTLGAIQQARPQQAFEIFVCWVVVLLYSPGA